jgi:hypothetical protein
MSDALAQTAPTPHSGWKRASKFAWKLNSLLGRTAVLPTTAASRGRRQRAAFSEDLHIH